MEFINQIRSVFLKYPEYTALRIRGESYTYAWLKSRSEAMAVWIESHIPSEQAVAISCKDNAETYALLLACLFTGRPYIPLQPEHPEERNRKIMDTAGIQTLTDAAELSALCKDTPYSEVNIEPCQTAYILFTSGSTGIPKGVPISYAALQAFLQACHTTGIELQAGNTCLQMFDLTFDLSIFSYLYPLCWGATICTVPKDEIKHLGVYRILDEENIHTALMVPSVVQMLRPYFEDIHLPALKQCLFCGEALPEDLMREFIPCMPVATVRNVYGPTEATIFCTEYLLPRDPSQWKSARGILSIGKALPGMALQSDAQNMLLLGGSQLTEGYLNDSEKNREAFIHTHQGRWYRSGDLAYQDHEGDWFFTGRADQQIKIQGYRIEPGEIEYQIHKLCAPSRVVTLIVPKENNQAEIHICIENLSLDLKEVQDKAAEVLPAYMLPSAWHNIPEFPLNVNGKTDRKALLVKIYAGI